MYDIVAYLIVMAGERDSLAVAIYRIVGEIAVVCVIWKDSLLAVIVDRIVDYSNIR